MHHNNPSSLTSPGNIPSEFFPDVEGLVVGAMPDYAGERYVTGPMTGPTIDTFRPVRLGFPDWTLNDRSKMPLGLQ